jgi:hypothetical protein
MDIDTDHTDGLKEICVDFSKRGNDGYFFRFDIEKTTSVCPPNDDTDLLEKYRDAD